MDPRNQIAAIELGRRIRRRREELGMSREEVAAQAGIDVETMEKVEAGELELGSEMQLLSEHAVASVSWVPDTGGVRRRRISGPPL